MESLRISNKELTYKILKDYRDLFSLFSNNINKSNRNLNNINQSEQNKNIIKIDNLTNSKIKNNVINNSNYKKVSNQNHKYKINLIKKEKISEKSNQENDDLFIDESNISEILKEIGESDLKKNNKSNFNENSNMSIENLESTINDNESFNKSNNIFSKINKRNNIQNNLNNSLEVNNLKTLNITNHSDNEINLNNTFENIVELNKLNENNLPKLIPRKENNQKILINMNKIKKNLNPLEIEERFNKYLSEYKKNNNIKKEILDCIKNIINKIKDIKSTGLENTFSGPYLIGSFHRFGIDSAIYEKNINIDILFTCSNLEKLNLNNYKIIKNLIKGILIGDLNLSGKDLSFNLNQQKNIIVYEIQLIEYSNIKICCYFIDIEQKKESNIVNNILLEQMKFIMLENKQILCFFLRKWRKKWNLNFIIPEILDQIVEDFYICLQEYLRANNKIIDDKYSVEAIIKNNKIQEGTTFSKNYYAYNCFSNLLNKKYTAHNHSQIGGIILKDLSSRILKEEVLNKDSKLPSTSKNGKNIIAVNTIKFYTFNGDYQNYMTENNGEWHEITPPNKLYTNLRYIFLFGQRFNTFREKRYEFFGLYKLTEYDKKNNIRKWKKCSVENNEIPLEENKIIELIKQYEKSDK